MITVKQYWVLYDEASSSYLKDPNILRPLYQFHTDGVCFNHNPFVNKGFEMIQNPFEALRFERPETALTETNLKHIRVYHPFVKFVEYALIQKG